MIVNTVDITVNILNEPMTINVVVILCPNWGSEQFVRLKYYEKTVKCSMKCRKVDGQKTFENVLV